MIIKRSYSSTVTGPLKGIRVLDMTRVLAGPYCTQILGDLGAEIIKIEQPHVGDDTRTWYPPLMKSKYDKHSLSAYFISVNRNKHSVTVDLKSEQGRSIIKDLARQCDVLIENYVPGKMKSLGLDYETMREINERLVYVSISGYGPDGPDAKRPGYDVVIEAEAGLMSITGETNGNPVKVGVAITDLQTGLYAHGAILAALYAREKSGQGQKIDVSLLETQVASLVNIGSNYLVAGVNGGRSGTEHKSIVPYQLFKTKPRDDIDEDNGIVIGAGNNRQFAILCNILNKPEWLNDERMATNEKRVQNRKFVVEVIQKELLKRTADEWMSSLKDAGLPCGPLNNIKRTFEHPQVLHRQMVVEVEHKDLGNIKMAGIPVKYSRDKPSIRKAPPLLGEDTRSVLKQFLNYSDEKIDKLKKENVI